MKTFAMARAEHKGSPMPFMGPLGGLEFAAANPINLDFTTLKPCQLVVHARQAGSLRPGVDF